MPDGACGCAATGFLLEPFQKRSLKMKTLLELNRPKRKPVPMLLSPPPRLIPIIVEKSLRANLALVPLSARPTSKRENSFSS